MPSSSDSSSWYTFTAQSVPLLLMQHSHPTLTFKLLILFPPTLYLLSLHPHHRLMLLAVSLYLLFSLPFPNSLKVLQWNAGGLRARRIKLIHFISSHPIDLICIQESNLNLSSSFRIPGFSALQSHGTHSRSGIFSTDVADASGGVLNGSSLLSFLNVYAPPIRSSTKDSRTNFFSSSILPSYMEAEAVDFSRFRFHRKSTASTASSFRFRFHIPGGNAQFLNGSKVWKHFAECSSDYEITTTIKQNFNTPLDYEITLIYFYFSFICHILSPFTKKQIISLYFGWNVRTCLVVVISEVLGHLLLHKAGDLPLSALPKNTTTELAGLFSTTSTKCRAPSREAVSTIFKIFLV